MAAYFPDILPIGSVFATCDEIPLILCLPISSVGFFRESSVDDRGKWFRLTCEGVDWFWRSLFRETRVFVVSTSTLCALSPVIRLFIPPLVFMCLEANRLDDFANMCDTKESDLPFKKFFDVSPVGLDFLTALDSAPFLLFAVFPGYADLVLGDSFDECCKRSTK